VLIHAGDQVLVLQPKMSGLIALDEPPDAEHVRLRIEFRAPADVQLQFWDRRGLGTIELLEKRQIHDRIVRGKLGPDALAITEGEFAARLSATGRPIKVALLDQSLLAGVGNLYASEMLHVAKIHPAKACNRLSRGRKRILYEAMQEILQTAIEYEGSTLADGTYRNTVNRPGSYQSQHLVYNRAGLPCPSCGQAEIRRIVQAQRSTFYCPHCQRW
jgi:formamidopyrimidine-DNA glycosylase